MHTFYIKKIIFPIAVFSLLFCLTAKLNAQSAKKKSGSSSIEVTHTLSFADYEEKVHAIWVAQMAATIMGFRFEHHTASVEWVDQLPVNTTSALVDDDWYYEMATVRAFEKYGINMSVQQLGEQWKENSCGSWGSSEQARLLMRKGILPPQTGHPKYNKLWFSIGPQFSADIYGVLAPGMPNLAAKMAREYGHINGYAEGTDGAVFVAGMVSIGFFEKDPKIIVRKAAKLINPKSPYRKCIDQVISMAEEGKSSSEIFNAIEDRWHIEYPATNNAVPNGGIVAASLWFGDADFLKTVNLAYGAADFTDADCNAANAAAVIGAVTGFKTIPSYLVKSFGDRIKGDKMGDVVLTPAVDESISELSKRTAAIGKQILQQNRAKQVGNYFNIKVQPPLTQPAELFELADLTKYWNPEWKLERAGFGGAGGGMGGIRGNTYLDGEILATYPRDEIRGLSLSRTFKVTTEKQLSFKVSADSGRVWRLDVFIGNDNKLSRVIEGKEKNKEWQNIEVNLAPYRDKTVFIRLYQRVLIPGKEVGNAYWKDISVK